MSLPERINAIKTITYDVPAIVESLENMGMQEEEITLDTVLDFVWEWVYDDMGSDSGVILQDENGNEL